MNRFEGKRILITGGTSGFGFAAAKRIVEEGGDVAVTGLTQEHLDEAGRTLPSSALVLRNDAGDPDAARELGERCATRWGRSTAYGSMPAMAASARSRTTMRHSSTG